MLEHVEFDKAFAARTTKAILRAESSADREFLVEQVVACLPGGSMLPHAMLRQQASLQLDSHNAAHPDAMRRIVTIAGAPVARIMVAWKPGESHGIDIAAMPQARATGVGLTLLRSWLSVCDATRRRARLEVLATNPARLIYRRLGFVETHEFVNGSPFAIMVRPPKSA